MRTVTVHSGNYQVLIGPGLLKEAGERVAQAVRGRRCAVVTDDCVGPLYARALVSSLEAAGIRADVFSFPNGEQSKTLATYARAVEFFADRELTRGDFVVTLGGGVARRPRRLRGGHLHARRRLCAGAHDAALGGGFLGRRQDGGGPAHGQKPRWRLPSAETGALRHGCHRQTAPAASARRRGGDGQIRRLARRGALSRHGRRFVEGRPGKRHRPLRFPSSATTWTRTSSTTARASF